MSRSAMRPVPSSIERTSGSGIGPDSAMIAAVSGIAIMFANGYSSKSVRARDASMPASPATTPSAAPRARRRQVGHLVA